MSRIGKIAINLPAGVSISIAGNQATVSASKGTAQIPWFSSELKFEQQDGKVWVTPTGNSKRHRQLWGTQCRLFATAVEGLINGYEKRLDIQGVGMRATIKGEAVHLQLGFSHEVVYKIPTDVQVKMTGERKNSILVSGNNKQRVGQVASEIRALRPPEPYKGKGIRYHNEQIILKEGKKK